MLFKVLFFVRDGHSDCLPRVPKNVSTSIYNPLFVGKGFNKISSLIPECLLKPRDNQVTGWLILPAVYICYYSNHVTSISVTSALNNHDPLSIPAASMAEWEVKP
jgi:hypothetical protein